MYGIWHSGKNLWQAVRDRSPPRLRQVPAAFVAGTRWIYSRYLLNLRQLPAGFAAGTCWFRGRYPLDLRQVPARFAAGTCWIFGRYLTGYKYGNVYFLVQKFFLFLNLINIYSNMPNYWIHFLFENDRHP